MKSLAGHLGQQGVRVVLLSVIIIASGIGLGLATGLPLSRVQFESSDAVQIDQARLAGEVDPDAALVTLDDLPLGWEPGDPALGGFGVLGAAFCGTAVELPTALSDRAVAVFANPSDEAYLVAEAVRVETWQSASDYVDELGDAVASCDEFYQPGLDGERVKLEVREGSSDGPITDHVSRTIITADGSSLRSWSVMSVGDVILAIQYMGPSRPQEGFITDLEDDLLRRLDPADFAPGGIEPTTTTTTDPTATTVIDGGPADETDTGQEPIPADPGP